MVIKLTYLTDPYRGMSVDFNQDIISIGRAANNDMVIDEVHVSSHHARIVRRGGQVFIEDQGSTNGTYVNGQRVTAPMALMPGATIQFGTTIQVRYLPESIGVDRTVPGAPGQVPMSQAPPPMPQPRPKRKFPVWLIILIVLIVGGLCVGVVLIGGGWAAFNFLQGADAESILNNNNGAIALQTQQAQVAGTEFAMTQAPYATGTAQAIQAVTAQAQQTSTAAAQQTQTVLDDWRGIITSAMATDPLYGPEAGTLIHEDENNVETLYTDVDFYNYVITARVYPPYLTDETDWDMGFFFHDQGKNTELRLAVESSGYFYLLNQNGDQEDYIHEGEVQNLNLDLNTPNTMTLLVWDDRAIFFLNDTFIGNFDISSRMDSGDVALVTNVIIGDLIPGAEVHYEDFGVYAVPVQ
ncbi:FHA domain-containing protein [bacterium]|nr:FHA domain-containing protein [bacterium]